MFNERYLKKITPLTNLTPITANAGYDTTCNQWRLESNLKLPTLVLLRGFVHTFPTRVRR